jgi:hypothetical protein
MLTPEAEECLGVVVEDLVAIGFGQFQTFDIGKGLLVLFVILQHRIVAAGHQVIGAEGYEGEGEGASSRSTLCRTRTSWR